MTPRKSDREGWRRLVLVLPAVLIALFVITIYEGTGNDLWAQASKQPPQKPGTQPTQPGRPAPTPNPVEVQRLVSLKTQLLDEFNQVLQSPEAQAKGNWIFHKHIGPDWFTESWIRWETARVTGVAPLTHAQLQEVRDVTARQLEKAIELEQSGKGGGRYLEGSFRGHVFTGKLRAVTGRVQLPEINSESVKNDTR
jgi:hypothetical protein